MAAKEISVKTYVVRLSGEERERRQDIQNRGQDPPATLLVRHAAPELVELIGLGHVPSAFRECVPPGLCNPHRDHLTACFRRRQARKSFLDETSD